MNIPKNGFYYHYKHDPSGPFNTYAYEVMGVAKQTEDGSYYVVYRPLYKNSYLPPATMSVRPFDMFIENVTKDGKTFPRFTPITDPELISKLEKIKNEMY